MATATSSTEEELSCPICFELFVDPNTPKNLPSCGHVLCEVCLKQMVTGQRTCPECRQVIKIPRDGIASFTTNYRLRNLAENYQRVEDNSHETTVSPKKSGVPFCPFENYQRVEDNSPETTVSPKKSGVPFCPFHEDEKMHFFCIICNSLACQACLVLKHNGTEHNIVDVKEIYRKQKGEMKSAIVKVKSSIDEEESILNEFKTDDIESTEIYKNVTEMYGNVENQIEKCVEDHINELLAQSQELKEQVEQSKQMHIEKLKKLKREISTDQKFIDSANVVYQAAVGATENLPDYEYITQHGILINKMRKIETSKQTTLASKAKQDVIKFVPNSSHTKLGQIISVTPERVRRIRKIQTLDGFINACILGSYTNGLFATTNFDANKVVVYHQVNDKYERKLYLKLAPRNRYKPSGITICPDGRFLVARYTCLEVYSHDGNHQNDIKIKGSDEVNVSRVQVTSGDRILVGDYHRCIIVEISPTGEVMRTVRTSIKPDHMVLIHDTHVAISDRDAGKVIVIDIESGQETLSIDIPEVQGVCYDEQTECLLTTGNEPYNEPGMILLNTGVIEQYSYTTGKLVACLQQGLYHPFGMTLPSDGHLIVANLKTVEIYEIK